MSFINATAKEIHCKIVYYGPELSGKTTNLEYVYSQAPALAKGELVKFPVETDDAAFFDFLPLSAGAVHGHQVRLHVYTVPGHPTNDKTRAALLEGVDGIVFVADSGPGRFSENIQSFYEIQRILSDLGKHVSDVPLVFQFNKRDLADAVPAPILNARINSVNAPHFLATAIQGVGVVPTLRAITDLVVATL